MKIGIISDTHGALAAWQAALSGPFSDVDMIIHAGDVLYHGPRNPLPTGHNPAGLAEAIRSAAIPLVIAAGNCDAPIDQDVLGRTLCRPYAFLALGAARVFVAHETETNADLWEAGLQLGADLIIGGHTHTPSLRRCVGDALFLNPGSPALPKGSEPEPTVAVVQGASVRLIGLRDGRVLGEDAIRKEL